MITGHSGFKGVWFSILLKSLGANVYGISLLPNRDTKLFNEIECQLCVESHFVDINNLLELSKTLSKINVDTVFHFAAQSLVPTARLFPFTTYATNISGTLNLIQSLQELNHNVDLVLVTTDKVYKDIGELKLFSEDDDCVFSILLFLRL